MKVDSCNCGMNFRGGKLILLKRGEPSQAIELAKGIYARNVKQVSSGEFGGYVPLTEIIIRNLQKKIKDRKVIIWMEKLGDYVSVFQKTPRKPVRAVLLNQRVQDMQKALDRVKVVGNKIVVPEKFSAENKTFLPFPTSKY